MTPDERNLLLLLAKMVLSAARKPSPDDRELRDAIRKLEDAESRARDKFVEKIISPRYPAALRLCRSCCPESLFLTPKESFHHG